MTALRTIRRRSPLRPGALRLVALALSLAGLASCEYDPSLGTKPFVCGADADSPLCPAGYGCTGGLCVEGRKNQELGSLDPATCGDLDIEPNDEAEGATEIDGPGMFENFHICTKGDADLYRLPDLRAGQRALVEISFAAAGGDLDAQILQPDGAGEPLLKAESQGDDEEVLFTAPSEGRFLIRIFGFQGATNGYNFTVTIQ